MSKKMIIRLKNFLKSNNQGSNEPNNHQEALEWLIIDENQNQIKEFSEDLLDNLSVYVIVPGNDVVLTTAKLPKLSTDQLMKAIPYALGEYLTEDPEKLHFAVGKALKTNRLAIAIVNKEKMKNWLARIATFFKTLIPNLKMLIPETLALPLHTDEWTIYIDHHDIALARTGEQSGFEIEVSELWIVLQMMLKKADITKPKNIAFYGEITIPPEFENFLKNFNITYNIVPSTNLLELLIANVGKGHPINLLQGPYKISAYAKRTRFSYLTAGILFAGIMLMLTFGLLAQVLILKSSDHQINKQIATLFAKTYPNQKMGSNKHVKALVQQTLLGDKAQKGFLDLMNRVVDNLIHAKGISILGLQYANNQLVLAIETNDFALLDKFSNELVIENTKTEIRDAVKTGSQIRAKLVIQATN